ncbi:hypothetical protein AAG570_000932 [Ranatra chinensis]|uniref:Myosin-IB n=1 Tax=Ranatra chinensis TaxID=642074 RepID=A0ABD0YZ50_9HEMI
MESLHERDRVGVQDAVLLDDFKSQPVFVENLRKRFKENLIYTYIGQVLVSVNPYKQLPIYGPSVIGEYQKVHLFEKPPHIYAITDSAYRSLTEESRNQCILISGESGSGKTEASKKVLEYVAAVSENKIELGKVKDKLLQSNPVLEAFGNAKTKRNNNSSRFGKYMDIQFDRMGNPSGGHILNYLLEKSRVIQQGPGERNFHIFYQLLEGIEDEYLYSLKLERKQEKYNYFGFRPNNGADAVNDAEQFKEVCAALDIMGITQREQAEIVAIIASILHLGNVMITEEEGEAILIHDIHIETAAKLLECDLNALKLALTQRTITAHGDSIRTPLNRELAVYARDALAKAIYERLFSWMVSRLNESLLPQNNNLISGTVMGILDIYGFEVFEKNSFEQFSINYCNEKLQQVFIELTLKSEQEEYLKEGIEWEKVEYFNNNVICNLIEERYKGIIALLDEECLRPGEPSDLTFLNKMCEHLSSHKHFVSHKKADSKMKKVIDRDEFMLIHYAGDVVYSVKGFIDKNKDLLFRDLREVMSETGNSITKSVFPKSELMSKKRPETAITQFKISLSHLMDILMSKEPSYIRCIKPNDFQKPGIFSENIVTHQVEYLGLMENLRVRRAGFAYRRLYEPFLKRYKSLCPTTWPYYNGTAKDGVQKLITHLGYNKEEYRMGKTKIFIRYARTLFKTEDAFQAKKHDLATIIQSHWKGLVERRKYQQKRLAAIVIEKWVRRYLAKRLAERRKEAVKTIRNFIKGFISRNGPMTDINRRFIQTAKEQYLLRLAKSLPKGLLSSYWPPAPEVCSEASKELRILHKRWLAQCYRNGLTPERKLQFEQKVLAESLFKGEKKSYEQSLPHWFIDNRLTTTQDMIKSNFLANEIPTGERILYSCGVVKFDRHGYKRRNRIVFLTNKAFFIVMEDGKQYKVKHKLLIDSLIKLEVTSEKDNFLLIRIPPELTKDKGDLILEVPNLIEIVTKIISITNNRDMLNINKLENGAISHNLSDGKTGVIDITQGTNGPSITKGKSGHLIVVG